MIELRTTPEFDDWIDNLRDLNSRGRIQRRLKRLQGVYPGDHKHLGDGILELRVHSGPGYRVYWVRRGETIIIVLAGGDKGSQAKDIRRAQALAKGL